ncbi:PAS domain-containing protein [Shewanella sp. SP2S2-4]|uniref:PAS domain-containing protein n=1 Tax=Shewanella vaxholmensis TaxID=3063535 RepID=A0ABU9UZA3_9GAMM|nr:MULTISPECIES: PAS domain-containing protein [unclassified Shewanella]MBU1390451.1 PAS domain-containing protein [Gammaproteobacteria bacterium]QYX65985.1 PAS domain-containing protein [Shewanella putrefaciens]MBU1478651.1 PAS domain-containing protein [Gammaproteobacteria bacterium]MBU2000191.1 PAS domain-containing protein [Gammaproteobacteria bacterium]MBU2133410.1 PAS domain-containing protein [Gammaproteobacteria bacterium]
MKLQDLTQSDLDILKSVENIVDGIAAMYGQHTEVVLHSLDAKHPSVVKIANGHVTGREVGAPITNLALLKLKTGQDISNSYLTKCANGKTLRSITTVIRNSKNQPIGLLCINSDMDAPLQSVLRTMMPEQLLGSELTSSPEVFARNIDEALHSTIDSINHEVRSNAGISPSQKNREIVNQLHELGIFELKDSAQVAATRLGISVHSIYRYLREIKANQA